MIDPEEFVRELDGVGVQFVTGVPDSLLKEVCRIMSNHFGSEKHVTATNEGSAVALAIGHYLATNRPALVYFQNSGLGNATNPLVSLASTEVYGIPMILMIGWRGEVLSDGTQLSDEPQHVKQGQITLASLDLMGIPHTVIDANTPNIGEELRNCISIARKRNGPVALVVRKNTFSKTSFVHDDQPHLTLQRENVISKIIEFLRTDTVVVATTGMISRELFDLRRRSGAGYSRDFLTVGGMGHASQIATGIAIANPGRQVVCLDGDGALLMHSGALAVSADCNNLLHIVINNEAHDSVGGQPTKGNVLRFSEIASAFGYQYFDRVISLNELENKLVDFIYKSGSRLLEICCKKGARDDLPRPNRTPLQNKLDFMSFMENPNGR